MNELSIKSEKYKIALDKTFIQLSKKVKQLYSKPVEVSKVQGMIKDCLDLEDLKQKLADTCVEELDQEFENMPPSPFTELSSRYGIKIDLMCRTF